MSETTSKNHESLPRFQAILWCCLLPNAVVSAVAGVLWLTGIFADWQPAGLAWLTREETVQRVQNVVGIGPVFVFLLLLSLTLVQNLLITMLVSGRGFRGRGSAFVAGFFVCLALPAVTVGILTLMQSRLA